MREKPWFTPMHMHMHMFYNTDKTPIDSFIAHKIYLFPNKPSRPPTTSVLRLNRSNVWAHSNPSLPGIQTLLQCNNKWHTFVRLLCHRAKIAKKNSRIDFCPFVVFALLVKYLKKILQNNSQMIQILFQVDPNVWFVRLNYPKHNQPDIIQD